MYERAQRLGCSKLGIEAALKHYPIIILKLPEYLLTSK